MSPVRRVQVLPDSVANQIAAGEVVERPASVVKELVENALDAGAREVEVRIEKGGKRRLRVSDDGSGMGREDAILSLDRHATSKIDSADDLRTVGTFGFRGEALPSIAAISRMTVETRERDGDVGTRVAVAGGEIRSVEDVARRMGTTVDVERLFYNAPARAKFLKSVRAEARAVSDVVISLALANPSVAFTLRSDDRTLLQLPHAKELSSRIAELWGDEEASRLIPVTGEEDGIRIAGLVQRPDAAGPGFRRAHLFVNRRPVTDPRVVEAADRGYRTTIAAEVRPWLFLYLQVGHGAVDVNVHPAKAEVRFRDGAAVQALVETAVRDALAGTSSGATLDTQLAPPRLRIHDSDAELAVREPAGGGGGPYSDDRASEDERGDSQMALFVSSRPDAESAHSDPEDENPATNPPPALFQVHRTWMVAEMRDGLLLIDQHSAHERVLYERLMSAYETGGAIGQRLLFPLTIRLTGPEYEQVRELEGLMSRAGFEVEGFGGDTVIVQAVPDPHPYFDAERCFREMIAELTHGSELVRSAGNQHERIAKTFACKGAIKAGQKLSPDEMRELVDQLFATELPHHDVHGRPTIVRLSKAELERKFGR